MPSSSVVSADAVAAEVSSGWALRYIHARAARAAGAPVVSVNDLERGPVAQVSDVPLVVPSEGVSFFQSVTAITAVVYGLLAGMEARYPERTRRAIQGVQRSWGAVDTYDDGPRGA